MVASSFQTLAIGILGLLVTYINEKSKGSLSDVWRIVFLHKLMRVLRVLNI